MQEFVDKVSAIFVPVVVGIAVVTLLVRAYPGYMEPSVCCVHAHIVFSCVLVVRRGVLAIQWCVLAFLCAVFSVSCFRVRVLL
jgi:cation transport ATPase